MVLGINNSYLTTPQQTDALKFRLCESFVTFNYPDFYFLFVYFSIDIVYFCFTCIQFFENLGIAF